MSRRAVFLDFDGVIVTEGSHKPYRRRLPESAGPALRELWHAYQRFDPALVANVATLCQRTGADVVLSTAWRGSDWVSSQPLVTALRCRGLRGAQVVGQTPDLSVKAGKLHVRAMRGHEIRRWLDERRPGWTPEDVVVLDDEDHSWDPALRARWVRSTFERGFGAAELAEALALFEARP